MSKLPYMEFYVDDYDAATMHLTFEEDGIYNRLLRLCWRTPRCSIPNDEKWICRRMRSTEWDKIESVLKEFFTLGRGRYFQKKQRAIFCRSLGAVQGRMKRSRAGGVAKSLKNKDIDHAKGSAKTVPKSAKALPTRTRTRTNKKRTIKKSFLAFWELWPRKIGRLHAESAWEKATKLAEPEEIMAGLKCQIEAWKAEGREAKFIPYPATWLNRGHWISDFSLTLTTPEQDGKIEAWRRGDWCDSDWREFLGTPGSHWVKWRLNNWICTVEGGRVPIGPRPGEPDCKMSAELQKEYGFIKVAGE